MDTTLLHLSASLGMSRLTCSLIHWSAESGAGAMSSRTRLCREVDALALDNQGFTPLVGTNKDYCQAHSLSPSLTL